MELETLRAAHDEQTQKLVAEQHLLKQDHQQQLKTLDDQLQARHQETQVLIESHTSLVSELSLKHEETIQAKSEEHQSLLDSKLSSLT